MKKQVVFRVGGLTLLLGILFQNCSQVPLESVPSTLLPFSVKGSMEICLEGSLADYTLETVNMVNLNVTPAKGTVAEDADADGIADRDEVALGFSPLKRRSNDKVLDSLCLDVAGSSNCLSKVPACSTTLGILGLNDCDLKALDLESLYGHPTQGLDSDKDGMVDLLEILMGTSPNNFDRYEDPDHDGILNWMEIQRGTNPNYTNSDIDEDRLLDYSVTKVEKTGSCTGELWKVRVNRLPLAKVEAFQDISASENALNPLLSHGKDENVIAVFLKFKTQAGFTGQSKIYSKYFRINQSMQGFEFKIDDFNLVGEVLP